MVCLKLLIAAFLLAFSCAQILNPPANVSSGYIRPSGPQALAVGGPEPAEQVSWFYTPNGFAVVDGDIIYSTTEQFNAQVINTTYNSDSGRNAAASNNTAPSRRNVIPPAHPLAKRSNSVFPNSDGLWPGGKITYRYADQETEDSLAYWVEAAVEEWKKAVLCLSFTKVPNGIGGSDPIVTIQANKPNQGYCLASLGYNQYGTFMSLDTYGACGVPEMIHEWGKLFQSLLANLQLC